MGRLAVATQRLADMLPVRYDPPRQPAYTAASRTITPDINALAAAMVRRRPEAMKRALWYTENLNAISSAERWVRNVLGDVRYVAAHLSPEGIPQRCEDPMVNTVTRTLHSGDWGRLASLVSFVGVGWVEARWAAPGRVEWKVRSADEYRWESDDKKYPHVIESPYEKPVPMVKPGEKEPLWFAVWYPGLGVAGQPYTPLAGQQALELCEALLLVTTVETAIQRSRLSNGILFVPSELSFLPSVQVLNPGEASQVWQQTLDTTPARMLQEYMLAPISDPSSPEAVVPIIIRGPAEYGAALKHLVAQHVSTPSDFTERRSALLEEIAMVLPIPDSVLLGLGQMNHWNGAITEDNANRVYWRPTANLLASAFTERFQRPFLTLLRQLKLWEGDPESFLVIPDLSEITRRPGDWQRDVALYGAKIIGGRAVRASNGYSEDDAPTAEELAAGAPPAAPAPLPPMAPIDENAPPKYVPGVDELPTTTPATMPPRPALNKAGGASVNPFPGVGMWATGDIDKLLATRTAATVRVEDVLSEADMARLTAELGAIDARLSGALQSIADDAVNRGLHKLGSRVFKLARAEPWRSRAAAASTDPTTPQLVLRVPGIVAATNINEEELLLGEIEPAGERAAQRIDDAHAEVDGAIARVTGVPEEEIAVEEKPMREEHKRSGVNAFKVALLAFATKQVQRAFEEPLNVVRLLQAKVPKSVITSVIAIAGGTAVGSSVGGGYLRVVPNSFRPFAGLGLGAIVARVIERVTGARVREYEWVHDHPLDPFEPHVRLHGIRFRTLDDNKVGGWFPGDHKGCLCSIKPVWSEGAQERRNKLLERIAESVEKRINESGVDEGVAASAAS